MNYKRLRSQIKSSQKNNADQIFSAFEAEGKAQQSTFNPKINHPTSNYAQQIEQIHKTNIKLGITFKRLNQHQRHAVFYPSKNLILSAMVGSGKTTVLIAKIFYLHFIKKVPFNDIIVLTFTNKAAREIKERIIAFWGDESPKLHEQMRFFGTFHAVARQILHEHPQLNEIGFKPGFMIMDEQEKQTFLERIIGQNNLNIKYQNQLNKRWKKYNNNGEVLMGNMKTKDDFEALVQLAKEEKQKINTMDFDDLIVLCNVLLKKQAFKIPKWIIVDEFQDCNEDQLHLINQLKAKETQLFVVGDQNQSIYGWRGSKEHLFQEMQGQWNATWMELPQNYRSTGKILSVAEALLQQNDGKLIATRKSGIPITITQHFDDQQEAYYLREQMRSLQKKDEAINNMAILFRTHQQIKIVETILAQANIPHQLVKRNALHDNPAQSLLLQILKTASNHNDIDACLALVCNKTFGCLKRTKTLIQNLQRRHHTVSALKATYLFLESQKKQPKEHLFLIKQIEQFKSDFLCKKETSATQLIQHLGLTSILKPTSIHHKDYVVSISEAWEQLQQYMQKSGAPYSNNAFHAALDQVVLEGSFQINDRIKQNDHGVHLLTIHASKGLEFDRIYIAGANTGIIPLAQHQKGSQNLKEEKRLLFVAITRAKNSLEIGWHTQPTQHNAEPEPSYFLNAIPDNLLERKNGIMNKTKDSKNETTEEWQIAGKVKHKKYGVGEIIKIEEQEITCLFKNSGKKTFSRAFAKALLSKVE